jgi:hypothetical protein
VQQEKTVAPETGVAAANLPPAWHEPWNSVDSGVVWVMGGVALLVRVFHLAHRSMWTDEFHTLIAVQKSWGEMVHERLVGGHLPLYFLIQKAWVGAAGTQDWAMRFPSAVYGALLVPMIAAFAWRSVSRSMLWGLLGMAALNGTMLWASQEARMYSLLALAATGCHLLYWRACARGGNPRWAAYLAALAATAAVQPVSLVLLPAHLGFSWSARRSHPAQWRVARRVCLAAVPVIIAGMGAFAVAQQKYTALVPGLPDPLLVLKRLAANACGVREMAGFLRHGALVLVVMASAAAWVRWRRVRAGTAPETGADPLFVQFCAFTTAVFALLLVAGGCLLPNVVGVARYLVPVAVPLWVVMLYGIGGMGLHGRLAMAALLAVTVLAGAVIHWADRGLGGREAVQVLARRAAPGDVVILSSSSTQLAMLGHYGASHVVPCRVPSTAHDDEESLRLIRDALKGRDRAWVFVYRDDKPRLQALLRSRPEWFRILDEYEDAAARLALLGVTIPQEK